MIISYAIDYYLIMRRRSIYRLPPHNNNNTTANMLPNTVRHDAEADATPRLPLIRYAI